MPAMEFVGLAREAATQDNNVALWNLLARCPRLLLERKFMEALARPLSAVFSSQLLARRSRRTTL